MGLCEGGTSAKVYVFMMGWGFAKAQEAVFIMKNYEHHKKYNLKLNLTLIEY